MKQHFQYRNKVIVSIVIIIAILYVLKLFYIQILNKQYQFSAKDNVLRYNVLQPTRGLIYDRDSILIVSNEPTYDLMIVPREVERIDTNKLCHLIKISKKEFRIKLENAYKYSKFKESVLIRQIIPLDAAKIQEQLYKYPGLFLRTRTMRKYNYDVGAHVIGYMGEVNYEKTQKDKYYTKGDISGANGIEASYENSLRGTKGMEVTLVDVHNRAQGKFNKGKYDTLPIRGDNIISTIDIKLQEYAESLMKNKSGAIVALEPATGEILALISSPSYSLKNFNGRKRSMNFKKLKKDINKPMFNRALSAQYPPGSTFKIINSLIALQEEVISNKTNYSCLGGYEYEEDKYISCHDHKSLLELKEAIAISCNTYFCKLFTDYFNKFPTTTSAYDRWQQHLKSFGIGEWMNNDFISGRKGFLPKSRYYDKYYRKDRWKSSTIISMAIGQGELLLTPIQMANMTAIIANKGYYYTPHIIKKIENKHSIDSSFIKKRYCTVHPKYFEEIHEGMEMTIKDKDGTARNALIEDIAFCGKTGTAQNNHGEDHSIFIAFAPRENPKIALSVYIENGGWGSTWAAPIASLVIEKYLKNNISNKQLEKYVVTGNLTHGR